MARKRWGETGGKEAMKELSIFWLGHCIHMGIHLSKVIKLKCVVLLLVSYTIVTGLRNQTSTLLSFFSLHSLIQRWQQIKGN
jgi:hypothetical protein